MLSECEREEVYLHVELDGGNIIIGVMPAGLEPRSFCDSEADAVRRVVADEV